MPGPIDDTLKHLTELSPQDWVVQGGCRRRRPASLTRTSPPLPERRTKSSAWPDGPTGSCPWIFRRHDTLAKLPDLLLYTSALFKRHGLRVRSLLVLLHRGADPPRLTGLYERGFLSEPFDVALRYRVLRVWQVAAERWLEGGFGLVPLAPLGDVRQQDLPALIARMKQRLGHEVPPQRAADLWSAAYILMGTRYERAVVQRLLQGVLSMKESVTYQAIIEEGEAIGEAKGKALEARKMIFLQGGSKFGEPPAEAEAALNALRDVRQLEKLGVRLLRDSSWEELLGLNGAGRRSRGRKTKD